MAGKPWYNNGINEIQVGNDKEVPDGYTKGRLKWSEERKENWRGKNNPNYGKPGYWTGKKMPKDSRGETLKKQFQSGERQQWNKGLSGDERCKGHKPGTPSWNKGLTQETDERVAKNFINWKNGIAQSKSYETKRKNNSFNTSEPEELLYKQLCNIYGEENIIRQYHDSRYPFSCDFYVISEDLFIELNKTWTHGGHPFDETNLKDISKLEIWKEKAETSNFYKNAIYTWTDLDVRKQNIAKKNNLNYKVIY